MSLFAAFDPEDHGEEAPAVVRPAGPTDLDACAAITAQREGGTTSTWRGVLERRWARPDQLVLVAECDGEVAAYASATHLTPTSEGGRGAPDGWYLTGVLVAPHHRRRGLGRRLTLARIALLRDRADRVWYVASSHNEASLLSTPSWDSARSPVVSRSPASPSRAAPGCCPSSTVPGSGTTRGQASESRAMVAAARRTVWTEESGTMPSRKAYRRRTEAS
ncbi:GNAT family N-acetyltransferase [Mobilicoccus sp.]|uniref:GNAT family N-acetyltransferase n=1 Tax=Mobilicoccus sp. TaxID=2034349 RepID=UPI00289929FB|nr:GNAT family N-acetyltransferase [Mobilicoccus sp.]